jgi:hypothetical protein
MGLFSRKKKAAMMDLPPPPSPEELGEETAAIKRDKPIPQFELPPAPEMPPIGGEKPVFKGDFPPIRGYPQAKMPGELPAMPDIPSPEGLMPGKQEEFMPAPESIIEEAEPREEIQPIFIEIADYSAILNKSKAIKGTLKGAEETVIRLGALKADEEKIISDWRKQLEDIEKRISYVDEVVFGGE